MANHKSAVKRHRQSLKARERNRMMKTRVKNATKALHAAIETKDTEAVTTALKNVTAILDKAASKKIVHWRTAARKISRLSVASNKI